MKRNRWTFGLGTIGRDMVYALVNMYLIFYMTDVICVPTRILWHITFIIFAARIFDACNDPVMGLIVDNTKTKFGKFKPWIAFGAFTSGILTILLFSDFKVSGSAYTVFFAVVYLLWGITFTTNDISYWSMLPALSVDQKEREKIGAVARLCANIGLFSVVAGIVPLTAFLSNKTGSLTKAYFVFAVITAISMWLTQSITLIGVIEPKITKEQNRTTLTELLHIIAGNDQLIFTALLMTQFMTGYTTTTRFGLYFFKYAYGDERMYSVFAVILGLSQITALSIFPLLSKFFVRKTVFTLATCMVLTGYVLFFFAPVHTMIFIGIAGILIFVGEAFIQLMMFMFLADCVDYGHWKLGKRNDSISFSLQPFISKFSNALGSSIVSAVIIVSGIKEAISAEDVSIGGLLMMKTAMLLFPPLCIGASYLLYRKYYKIDETMYKKILDDLELRGELTRDKTRTQPHVL